MKKQVLVSVDRGETRVALLEASGNVPVRKPGTTTRRRRRPATPGAGYRVLRDHSLPRLDIAVNEILL